MTDQLDRLLATSLDELSPTPKLGSRIAVRVRRAEARRRTRRAAAAVGALVAVLAATVVTVDRREDRPVVADASARPFRWERLPDAPIPPRANATAVWTGSEFLVWGGGSASSSRKDLRADGAAYDPAARRWRKLAPAPIGPRQKHWAVWTGTEMLVWGGTRPGGGVPSGWADGAAYDPVADTWRRIPEAPIGGRIYAGATWTGGELVVVGGQPMGGVGASGTGAAYDPVRDTWRMLPDLGFTSHTNGWAAWTGSEVLYWRPAVRGVEPALFSYDPVPDAWTELAPPAERFRLAWDGAVRVWADDRLVVTSGSIAHGELWAEAEAIAYDPAVDRWERLVRRENTDNGLVSPLFEGAVWTGFEVVTLGVTGYRASAFEPRTGRWYALPRPPVGLGSTAVTATDDGDVYAFGEEAAARLTRDP